MSAKDFYNKRAFKHQLKRAIKHDKQYFEDGIIELMEMYAQEQVKKITISESSELQEVQVSYRPTHLKKRRINSSQDSSKMFRELFPVDIQHREAFTILLLNSANDTVGHFIVGIGGINSTTADVRLVFQTALKCNATAIILCHNHPSGRLVPSEDDKRLTKQMVDAGEILDIKVFDHVILTADSYLSFFDEGLINREGRDRLK